MARFLAGAAILFFLSCFFAQAKQMGDSLTYSFSGRLKAATRCAINNDKPIEVHFGKVGISKIDRGDYVQDIPYSLDCGSVTSTNSVMLTITATPETWDSYAMRSSVEGLGAYVLSDGQPLRLNTLIRIDDPAHPPKLQAKLVKEANVELTAQPFTVAGTMVVEYL